MRRLVQFRLDDQLAEEIARRQRSDLSPSLVAKRDLQHYYTLLRDEFPSLSAWEMERVREAWDASAKDPRMLWAEVRQVERRAPALFRAASGDALVPCPRPLSERLSDLTTTQLYALADRVERDRAGLIDQHNQALAQSEPKSFRIVP